MLTLLITIALSFFLGYASSHYTVTTWTVKPNVAIVVGVITGVLVALFATLTVGPLVNL